MFVLHVLPVDVARGAQVFARAMADEANRATQDRHEIVVLFRSGPSVLRAEHRLGVSRERARRVGFDPLAVWRLRSLIRRLAPDVVVAHGGESLKYAVFGTSGAALVSHAIGVMPVDALRGVRGWIYRRLWSRSELVVAVSTDVAHQLRDDLGVPAVRLRVIPNGRPVDSFGPAADGSDESREQVVFVGHLTRTKRPEMFVEVVRRLRGRGQKFEAVIGGGGPLEGSIRSLAEAAGVRVLGETHDVPALLAMSTVFLFTSMPEGEGMPGVLIEAGLSGLATVTTAVPGARDVVVDGKTGQVVGVDDVQGLTDAVHRLLQDPALRKSQGAAARVHCRARFALESCVQAWVASLTEVASASGQTVADWDGG